jgi:hypothetical protein
MASTSIVADHGGHLTDFASASPAGDSAPAWALAGDLVLGCPLCDYNLRGLTDPRCPECGYQFQWRDLTDPARRVHPYIFEQHPNRNIWSFIRTAIGGLRPWKFWSSLRPDQTSRPRRMIVYWFISMVITLLLMLTACAAMFARETAEYNAFARSNALYYPSSTPMSTTYPVPLTQSSYFDANRFGPSLVRHFPPLFVCWVGCMFWPWLTLLILMIFRVSMRRARVKTEHVLRTVLYSGDAFMWPVLIWTALLWVTTALMGLGFVNSGWTPGAPLAFVLAILCLLPAIKLWAGYQKYLRFRHALGTIVASQIILILAVTALIVNIAYFVIR